ncbi:MAG: tetratricopeptide repeat protein [Rhodoferax sp.]|nr:tetratricopeptide repeat protein [Rhodoferax sp.]
MQSLQQALSLQPDNFDALASQGAMLHGQGRATEAEANLRKALALQPDSVNTMANLGLAQFAQDRPDEALAPCTGAGNQAGLCQRTVQPGQHLVCAGAPGRR